jgi:hypothetical protein
MLLHTASRRVQAHCIAPTPGCAGFWMGGSPSGNRPMSDPQDVRRAIMNSMTCQVEEHSTAHSTAQHAQGSHACH